MIDYMKSCLRNLFPYIFLLYLFYKGFQSYRVISLHKEVFLSSGVFQLPPFPFLLSCIYRGEVRSVTPPGSSRGNMKEGIVMAYWEYEINTYPVQDMFSAAEEKVHIITCDPKGVCLFKDMPTASREALTGIFNDRGAHRWELVETHYSEATAELVCVWKREKK
jgi:hypothetical protein